MKNSNLHAAKVNKNDEFYTRFEDINFEINLVEHGYRPFFKDKIVYCNCDDPEESNFWKFFKARFNGLKLKKLISTHYDQEGKSSYKLEYDGERELRNRNSTETAILEVRNASNCSKKVTLSLQILHFHFSENSLRF